MVLSASVWPFFWLVNESWNLYHFEISAEQQFAISSLSYLCANLILYPSLPWTVHLLQDTLWNLEFCHHKLLYTAGLCHTGNYWCIRDYWISRCYGVLPHSHLSTLQLPRFSLQLAGYSTISCSTLCQCVFLYVDISDAYDNVSRAPLSWASDGWQTSRLLIFYPTAIQIHS